MDFAHANKPDYVFVGNMGGGAWCEFRSWNGTDFNTGGSVNKNANIGIGTTDGVWCVEVKIPRTDLGTPSGIDVQVYLSGDNAGEAVALIPSQMIISLTPGNVSGIVPRS